MVSRKTILFIVLIAVFVEVIQCGRLCETLSAMDFPRLPKLVQKGVTAGKSARTSVLGKIRKMIGKQAAEAVVDAVVDPDN